MLSIPTDILKKILFLLKPRDLQSECRSNRYVYNICKDDRFFKEYVVKHFDLNKLKFQNLDPSISKNYNGITSNWKLVLKKLTLRRIITIKISKSVFIKRFFGNSHHTYKVISSILMPVYFTDTLKDIYNRIIMTLEQYDIDQKQYPEVNFVFGKFFGVSILLNNPGSFGGWGNINFNDIFSDIRNNNKSIGTHFVSGINLYDNLSNIDIYLQPI